MQTSERIGVPSLSGVWEVQQQPEEQQFANAALSMSLSDWLLLIPDYDGCPARLEAFSAATRYVASRLGPGWERALLLALGPKLRGRARASFGHRLHRNSSIEKFLASLRMEFGGCEAELLQELSYARQHDEEKLWEYGARLDGLVSQIRCLYEEESDNEVRRTNTRLVGDLALATFRRGLKSAELEARLGVCEPKSLEEAIGMAVSLDNELRFRDKLLEQMQQQQPDYVKKRRYR